MKVAYLVNQYPRNSHSFIRREILAMEARGVEVLRHSVRPLDGELADPADRAEVGRTRVVLAAGAFGHLVATLATAVLRPRQFWRGLRTAWWLGAGAPRGRLRHLVYLAEACVLARWLRRQQVPHLHAHFATNSTDVAMLCQAVGGPPFSFTVHGAAEVEQAGSLHLADKMQAAAFVVAVSGFGRSQLWRWARPEDWSKIHLVRCGLGEDFLADPGVPVPATPRFVCVARMIQGKGHLVLVDAVAELAAAGIACEVQLIGDGPFRPAIERRIQAAGLQDRIRLLGQCHGEQIRAALLGARALVHPSFAEGLPVVVMESLALGRPAIATAVAGTPELVEPGRTGWLVPAGSAAALARAMREALAATPDQLEVMGRAGAALVRAQHDIGVEAGRLHALFAAGRDRA